MSVIAEGNNTEMAPRLPSGAPARNLSDIIRSLVNEDKLTAAERLLEKIKAAGRGSEAEICFAGALIDIRKKNYKAAEKKLCLCLKNDPENGGARRKLLHLLYPYEKKCPAGTLEALLAAGGAQPGAGNAGTKLRREFLVYCCLGEYAKAFKAGERLLNGRILGATELTTPWEEYFTPSRQLYQTHYDLLARMEPPAPLRIWKAFYLSRLASALKHPAPFAPLKKALRAASTRYGWMHLIMGIDHLEHSRYAEALKCMKKTLSAIPNDWRARCLAAETYIGMGDNAKAFAQFRLAAEDQANSGELWNIRTWEGEMHLLCGNYRQAYLRSDEALKLKYDTMQLGWKGAAALMLGRTQEALDCLSCAVSQKPEDLEARVWRAEALMARREHKKALQDLEHVLRADNRYLWAYLNRAILYYRTGNYSKMEKDFSRLQGLVSLQNYGRDHAEEQRRPGPRAIYRALLLAHKNAGGNRRNDSHLFPLLRRSVKKAGTPA